MIGKTLAHYEVTALLGRGGMGEVYRAHDTRLGRDVAIKVLPAEVHRDPERLARFRREARTLATLQHPNVASIYGFEDTDDVRFLVMELVEGEDLATRLQRGRFEVDDALEIALQIAAGLEAAHEKGIVHRDLKPANVMITPEGRPKILDFGLARAMHGESVEGEDLAHSPTITAAVTMADTLLGTAAYMSPEQARGQAADRRADVWSFGVVLFEMLTGRRAFEGDTVSDKLAAILKSEPDWSALPPSTPPRLRELLERCLAKKRGQRMRDIGDVRLEIEWILSSQGAETTPAASTRGVPIVVAILAAVLLATVTGLGAWMIAGAGHVDDARPDEPVRRLSLQFPPDLDVSEWLIASDGTVCLAAQREGTSDDTGFATQLYLRRTDSFEFEVVEGSSGLRNFCFSPDARWIAFLAPDRAATGLYLWKRPVDGSAPPLRMLRWTDDWDPSFRWLADDDILVGTFDRHFLRISPDGSVRAERVAVRAQDFEARFAVRAGTNMELPDGEHLLGRVEVWTDSGYELSIAIANVNTGESRRLVTNADYPRWLDSGHLLFSRGSTLLAVPFDLKTLTVAGRPVAVGDGLRTRAAWAHGEYGLSADGTLFNEPGGLVGQTRRLAWTDARLQSLEPWHDVVRPFMEPMRLSPDDRYVAFVLAGPTGLFEAWVSEIDVPRLRRVAAEVGRDCTPMAWTPDGTSLIYTSYAPGQLQVKVVPVDESSPARQIAGFPHDVIYVEPEAVDSSGELVLATRWTGARADLVVFPFASEDVGPEDLIVVAPGAANTQLSRDGEWIAYESQVSGRLQVYVRRWLGGGRVGPEIQLSVDGGREPHWTGATRGQIWFHWEGRAYSAEVRGTSNVTAPEVLSVLPRNVAEIEFLGDGRALGMIRDATEVAPGRLEVTLNWRQALRERLGN